MNSFVFKKHPEWTWERTNDSTRNEIDYIISKKQEIIKDETAINEFYSTSDHRLVRAKGETYLDKAIPRIMVEKIMLTSKTPSDVKFTINNTETKLTLLHKRTGRTLVGRVRIWK